MSGLDLAKKAIALLKENRGEESMYLQCERFDGAYTQAAWQDNWHILTYASARRAIAAAQAGGYIYTTDLNDSRISAGEKVYSRWGEYDHVMTVIGRDSGGLLVTNTANGGDNLGWLGNHVKISHAHTIGLPLVGISSRSGQNDHIQGVDMWLPDGNVSTTPQPPVATGNRVRLDNWAWYTSASDAVSTRNPHGRKWTGEQNLVGDYVLLGIESNGALRVQANDGSTVWVHPSATPNIYSGSGGSTPTPSAPQKITLDGWAWFTSADEAQAKQNPHGVKWTGENYLVGTYDVQAIEPNGAIRITAKDGSTVWVNSAAQGNIS